MSKLDKKILYRVVDANFNRAKEGLRVCEDVCRFVLNIRSETKALKDIRHELSALTLKLKVDALLDSRAIEKDIGKETTALEASRSDIKDVFYANVQRVKESVRVLEEIFKLLNKKEAERFKRLRYQIYAIEKKVSKKI